MRPKPLMAKGVSFGSITLTKAGLWDTSKVEGLPRPSILTTGSHVSGLSQPIAPVKKPRMRMST